MFFRQYGFDIYFILIFINVAAQWHSSCKQTAGHDGAGNTRLGKLSVGEKKKNALE